MGGRTGSDWRRPLIGVLVVGATVGGCSGGAGGNSARPRAASPSSGSATVPSSPTASGPTAPPPSDRPAAPRAARPLPLAGKTIVIDPGHNGGNTAASAVIGRLVDAGGFLKPCDTAGTQTNDGYPEYAFAMDLADRAATLVRNLGARVILTRTDSRGVGPCIDRRAAVGNAAHAAAAISIHADGGPPNGYGFHVIEPALAPNGGNAAIIAPSARLALQVRSAFARITGEPYANYIADQGLSARNDLGGLNLSRVPKVFIESANLRNAADALRAKDPAWRQRAAEGIATGLAGFLER